MKEYRQRNIRHQFVSMLKRRTVAVALAVFSFTLQLAAQNNPYKIDDRVYPIYTEAYKYRIQEKGLQLADSAYNVAKAIGDKKGRVISLTIPILYYYYKHDLKNLEAYLVKLKDEAIKFGYPQYYYFGAKHKTFWYLNDGQTYNALTYAKEIHQYAVDHQHAYGIFDGWLQLGQIYDFRQEYRAALSAYNEALKYGEKNLPDQDMSECYRCMADIYYSMRNYEMQLKYADKGLATVKSDQTKRRLLETKARALFMLGKNKEFMAIIDSLDFELGNPNVTYSDLHLELLTMKYIAQNRTDEMKKIIREKLGDKLKLTLTLENLIDEMTKDYKGAYFSRIRLNQLTDSLNQQIHTQDVRGMKQQLDNGVKEMEHQRAELRNAELQLQNTQLTLENSELELRRSKADEEMALLNSENLQLSINNKKMEADNLRDSLNKQDMAKKEKELSEKTNRIWLFNIGITAIIIFIAASGYLYHKQRMSKKLRIANNKLNINVEELKIARDEAQEANVMKTKFIQNMSHEIRTPLNSIVGFSKLLADIGDTLSEEEKKDMKGRITSNSELLLTIINDILDLTTLESGRYKLKLEEVRVNDLCRNALDTQMPHKPENVEMIFASELPDTYTITTDESRVRQVLTNFISNSIKNTERGEIRLDVWAKEEGILQLAVTDTGIGIPVDKMEQVFERFKKLDTFKQGTGLGLSICLAVAERLGGRIFIDKDYHDGARFVFEINI